MTTNAPSESLFNQLFFFGDSLSDDDNFYKLSTNLLVAGLPLDDFGYSQNFTNAEVDGNGAVWTTEAAALLGLSAEATHNFAFGGARVLDVVTIEDLLRLREGRAAGLVRPEVDPDDFDGIQLSEAARALLAGSAVLDKVSTVNDINLTGQVANALASIGGQFDSGTAATFLIGGNDYIRIEPGEDAQAFVTQLVTTLLSNAALVAAAGVETLIYVTLPSLSSTPVSEQLVSTLIGQGLSETLARGTLAQLDQLIGIQNQQVSAGFQALGQQFNTEAKVVDLAQLSEEIQADLSSFGFKFGDSRIVGNGATPSVFQDFNANGVPDIGLDPNTGEILDLPFPFISADINGDGQADVFVATNAESLAFDLDEIAFFDGLHPSAAYHDLIASFYTAALTQPVSFLTAAGDRTLGSNHKDLIFAKAGNDEIQGKGGDDVIFGGLDDDIIMGNKDQDIVVGGAGNDTLIGSLGGDIVVGSDGDDRVLGRRGSDILIGGKGNDDMRGGSGNDLFIQQIDRTAPASDDVRGGLGRDTLFLEVDSADFEVVQSRLEEFRSGRRFQLAVGENNIELYSIEQVVLGRSDDRAQFAEAYAQAFSELDAKTVSLVDTAARWNQLDPIV